MTNVNFTSNSIKPMLSVVVGSQNARASISKCLRALERQRNGDGIEIIVVDNSTDDTADIVSSLFPTVRLLRCEAEKLMPELWEIGISESNGDLVAITTSQFVADESWISAILKAHQSPYAGIGGAIENDKSAGLVSWAVYFCRYSPYMLPFPEITVNDFAGDNSSYKRATLDRFQNARRNGFWELAVHTEMRKSGLELLLTPKIVMYHQNAFTLLSFMKQRFWHGRQFGSERALTVSIPKRVAYILLSPLIPALFLSRIARRVIKNRKHIKVFVLSSPILLLFLLSWGTGELSGYLWASATGERSHSGLDSARA